MLAKGKILVVDDDAAVRDSLEKWFDSEGYRAQAVKDAQSAIEAARKERWDVALVDLKMPGVDGTELQLRLLETDPDMPVIIMTGYASVETAVRTLKNGAYDYIVKPFDPDELVHLVGHTLEHSRSRREVARLRENLQAVTQTPSVIGQSPAMKRVIELADTAAPMETAVLITGERGTGKETVARAIHAASPRRLMPFVVIHCGALTEAVAEGDLFGYESGAFTDDRYRRKGRLETADGGTVFLNEVSELTPKNQKTLLRVLQDRQIIRVGGGEPVNVDFRPIAASHTELDSLVRDGAFLSDLFYRLGVVSIDLPPLRDRKEDIPLLVDHFLHTHSLAMNRPTPKMSKAALDLLLSYEWPGNVRELENAMERALLITSENEIQEVDFPFQLNAHREDHHRSLAEVERLHIEKVVTDSNWNLSKAARILQIDRTTLYNKLRRYGLR
jgi:DNA-binding NtrC family response regulator